ncbi:ankyrin repeat domain-containing protein [Rhodococcus sp. NPDC058514]|uniref:ankyrin repeat domain-containing protein n=1 Tax=unclassified Rhodococcus (in: high G+C Gram-positive bacteria) TaxID=192944 RepID=UPI003653E26E
MSDEGLTRHPDRAVAVTSADEFLLSACLLYSPADGDARRQRARSLLAADPALAARTVHTAAACADIDALWALLSDDPAAAGAEGGPLRWPPLLYLAYARHDAAVTEAATVTAARLLLAAGADPNAGYLWHGEQPPFTALTGAFGNGERGSDDQPPHPHADALARVLLEAGANPNDGQALYNRMFARDDTHLRLLLKFGLGRGDREPWSTRLGVDLPSPAELLGDQLGWAILHGHHDRVDLLLGHGADPDRPLRGGRTPLGLALVYGKTVATDALRAAGAREPDLDPADRLMAAAMTADRAAATALAAADPGLAAVARRRHPSAILRAVAAHSPATGKDSVVRLLADLGFDVNALGRSDLPIEQPWETALHEAAGSGNRDLVVLLLSLGADPSIRDHRFGSTPAAWAAHFGHSISELGLPPPERA